jgi:hypothetical protein
MIQSRQIGQNFVEHRLVRLSTGGRKMLKATPIVIGVAVLGINSMYFVSMDPKAAILEGVLFFGAAWGHLMWNAG